MWYDEKKITKIRGIANKSATLHWIWWEIPQALIRASINIHVYKKFEDEAEIHSFKEQTHRHMPSPSPPPPDTHARTMRKIQPATNNFPGAHRIVLMLIIEQNVYTERILF